MHTPTQVPGRVLHIDSRALLRRCDQTPFLGRAITQGHARWAEPVQLDEREEAMPLQVLVLFPLASFVQVFFAWHFSEPLADLHCRGRGS